MFNRNVAACQTTVNRPMDTGHGLRWISFSKTFLQTIRKIHANHR